MSNRTFGFSLVLPPTSFGNVLVILFSVSLAAAIIFLNMSVSLSILLNSSLRSENRFMYMLSTCLSDICTGVSYYYVGVLHVRDFFDSPTRTFYIVPTFLGLSYMAILAAQADRYHAVVSPFKYTHRMTRRRTLMVIVSYWVYAFFIVALNNLVKVGVAKKITSIGTFVGNIFTVIIMIGLNIRLFFIARFQLEREPPSEEREVKRSSVYLILVVAVFFLGVWLPLFFHVIACNFFGSTCYTFRNEGTDPLRILPRVNAALTPHPVHPRVPSAQGDALHQGVETLLWEEVRGSSRASRGSYSCFSRKISHEPKAIVDAADNCFEFLLAYFQSLTTI